MHDQLFSHRIGITARGGTKMKLLSNEKGQMMIVFALGFAVLCGVVGMSIDAGRMYWERSKLQTALDAACLAGAEDLPDQSKAIDTLKIYAEKNGLIIQDGAVEFQTELKDSDINSPNKGLIRASASRQVNLTFMPMLGFSEKRVVARSAAAKKGDPVFDYVIFNGSEDVPLNIFKTGGGATSQVDITGSVHSNCEIVFEVRRPDTIVFHDGVCESNGTITPAGIAHTNTSSGILPMPDYEQRMYDEAYAAGNIIDDPADIDWDDVDWSRPIWIDGNITLTDQQMFEGCIIIATGTINITTGPLHGTEGKDIFIYSTDGDIVIDNNNFQDASGIIYAPKGDINYYDSGGTAPLNSEGLYFVADTIHIDTNKLIMSSESPDATIKYGKIGLVPYDG